MVTSSPGCLVIFYMMLMTLYLRTCFFGESLKPRMKLLFLTKSSAFAFSSWVSPSLEPLSIRYTALISQNYSGSVNLSCKFMVTTSQGRIFFFFPALNILKPMASQLTMEKASCYFLYLGQALALFYVQIFPLSC